MNYGILETKDYLSHPNQIIQSSSLKISEKETAEMLKIILREMKTKSRIAIGSIPAFAVFTTMLEMPVLSPEETRKAVEFQAPQYIPLPMSEVALDWVKAGNMTMPTVFAIREYSLSAFQKKSSKDIRQFSGERDLNSSLWRSTDYPLSAHLGRKNRRFLWISVRRRVIFS